MQKRIQRSALTGEDSLIRSMRRHSIFWAETPGSQEVRGFKSHRLHQKLQSEALCSSFIDRKCEPGSTLCGNCSAGWDSCRNVVRRTVTGVSLNGLLMGAGSLQSASGSKHANRIMGGSCCYPILGVGVS